MATLGIPNVKYRTCYIRCPTGRYKLAGDMPAYFVPLLFSTEDLAKQALAEAESVLQTRRTPEGSVFAQAYLNGPRRSGYVIVSAS